MNPRYTRVAERAGKRCEYCRAREFLFNSRFEVEHIIPMASGGDNSEHNLALACRSGNVHKAASVAAIDPETEMSVRLFSPRDDSWPEHFRLDAATARLEGLTPGGRATVVALNMNSPEQLSARVLWLELGIYS